MRNKEMFFIVCAVVVFITGCSKTTDYYSEDLDQLKSLPYVSWTAEDTDVSISGVTTYIKEKAYPGYNLFFNLNDRAYLLDMDGKIVHVWYMPYHTGVWEYGYLKPNGNLIAYCTDLCVTELDWYSNTVWYTPMRAHHDVEMLPDGTYLIPYTLAKQYKSRTVLFNTIRHLSKKGTLIDEWSTWDHLEEIQKYQNPSSLDVEPEDPELEKDQDFDYFHLNSIKILPSNTLGKTDNRFREGNWLISFRNASLVIILDKDSKEIVWAWGPDDLDWQHMPVMLESGEILIFDNGLTKRNYSRVIQLNPVTKTITWEYKTDPPEKFFSNFWGGVQRLPNGNTLITNSANGHVFELTENKNIVWEYYNFDIQNDTRKRIYRMMRYPEEMIESLLENLSDKKSIVGKLKNPGFELSDGVQERTPASWKYSAWIFETAELTWDKNVARTGSGSAKIVFTSDNVGYWGQLLRVEPHTSYRLTGWVKMENVPGIDADGTPAGVSIAVKPGDAWPVFSDLAYGNVDWTQLTCDFNTEEYTEIEVQCNIGSAGSEITGTAWFDDIQLEKIQ
ncbi:MAG: aryl-sulfate sulfotransferase [Spirochaetales bacterium]|nr:aryl-sulfate sulfotransferase [Spirochaetales bacterium]